MPIKRLQEGDFEAELNKSALWAVTYGDLMSYLMIFFLIMFAFTLGKRGPGFERKAVDESLQSITKVFGGKVDAERMARIEARKQEGNVARNLEEAAAASEGRLEIKANEERIKVTMKDAVLFDSGKADVKAGAFPILEEVAKQIKTTTNEVVVGGHTDNVPIRSGKYSSNYELSMARAYAVVEFFLRQGVDPKRLSGAGYGEYRPAADNSTAEARAKNRRIEIDLLKTQ